MSEFTNGVLYLKKYAKKADSALQSMKQAYKVKALNDQWIALFPKDANPRLNPLRKWLLETSKSFPMLYFAHAEDHGWEYKIFHDGVEIVSFDVNYELDYSFWRAVMDRRYPGEEPHPLVDIEESQKLYEEIYASATYKNRVQEMYQNAGIDQFALFELSDETLQQLHEILKADWYFDYDRRQQQLAEFQRLLNIEEMSWMSFHYLSHDA